MSEMQGAPSALGIESVECFSEGGRSLTVRVTGRWRRRRPDWHGQPVLVVEAEGRRNRFPAMPDPPSLTGAVPGTWRMTFSVPAELAKELAERASLQLGAAVIPLPVTPVLDASGRAAPADPELLAARRLRSSELAVESARRRAAEAEAAAEELANRVEQLERELEEARREPERLAEVLAARERAARIAEQRAHAEAAERIEASGRLSEQEQVQRALRDRLRARIRALEEELGRTRRAADEAQHLAEAARVGRADAGRPGLNERFRAADVLRAEQELAGAPPGTANRETVGAVDPGRSSALLEAELETIRRWGGAELGRLRRELIEQRVRSERVYRGLEELRGEIARLSVAPAEPEPPDPASGIDAERLAAALTRLREAIPAEPQAQQPRPAGSRLGVFFRGLLARVRGGHR